MATPFLKQVARHYFVRDDFPGLRFVFPNRRSSVFFRKYVCSCAAEDRRASLMPECVTINDLFASLTALRPGGRIPLLVALYECYVKLFPAAESLDEFICWGDVLLGDFNDVDKYLVEPAQIFTNVADLKSMEDDFSYLSAEQRAAIESFLSHFSRLSAGEIAAGEIAAGEAAADGRAGAASENAGAAGGGGKSPVKENFLKIWNILLPLYESFNARLRSGGEAYEGMIYREAASLGEETRRRLGGGRYVFVGLNALNECEKKLLRHLRDAGQAEFCWDWSSEWIRDPDNRASFFMSRNVSEFPQSFRPDAEGLPETVFNLVSVPSSIGQAKQLPYIFGRLGESNPSTETAVVLPDESLLMPVLNSIPDTVTDINVTMGYPLTGSDIFVLVSSLAEAHTKVIEKGGKVWFHHRPVRSVLSSSIFRKIATETDRAVCAEILKRKESYVDSSEFAPSPLLGQWFAPLHIDFRQASRESSDILAGYLKSVLNLTGALLVESGRADLDADFAKDYYKAVSQLADMRLEIRPATFLKLLDRLTAAVSVPFNGEPLKGLQVMGPLETRALDFKNLIILSCNEGTFPRRSFTSSFIPPELRKGFGLPTYEYQDAVWAYYFYRMIQRAENAWMLCDTRTEDMKTGEESRYVKQLDYLFGAKINRYVTSPVREEEYVDPEIFKTPEDMERLRGFKFSATAVENYLSCPAKFYYASVLELSDLAESADNLDGGTLGTVFHAVMQWIYAKPGTRKEPVGRVDEAFLLHRLSKEFAPELDARIRREICEAIKSVEVRGKDIVLCRVIAQYVRKTLEYDLKLLRDKHLDHFTVLALEKNLPFVFGGGASGNGYAFKGFIDRLDSFGDGTVRVVDYKTGRVTDAEMAVMGEGGDDEARACETFDSVFAEESKSRPKIALQFFIYNLMLRLNEEGRGMAAGRKTFNTVYSVSRLFGDGCPEYALTEKVVAYASEKLKECLDGLFDVEANPTFRRTEDADVCKNCDFKMICGR